MQRDSFNSSRLRRHPSLVRVMESGRSGLPSGMTTGGALTPHAQACALMIRDNKEREKREIADLNNRLARYIEKVRFLEAQNRVLDGDILLFRQAANIYGDRILVYFESEKKSLQTLVLENRARIDNSEQNIRKLEPELNSVRSSLIDIHDNRKRTRQEKRDHLKKLSELEAENAFTKRLINESENEKAYLNNELSKLRSEIKKVLAKRDKEKTDLNRSQLSVQEFLKKVNGSISQHEIAIREEISKARRDSTNVNRDYFNKELHSAMKDIRDQLDKESRAARQTWEEWYRRKITEIKRSSENFSDIQTASREETLRIRSHMNDLRNRVSDLETSNQQLAKKIEDMGYREEEDLRLFEAALTEKENNVLKMREECTKLSVELDRLCDNQVNLHAEIAYFRKLMENAENVRTTVGSNVIIDTPSPVMRTTSYHNYGAAYSIPSAFESSNHQFYSSFRGEVPSISIRDSRAFTTSSKRDVRIVDIADNEQSVMIENVNSLRSYDLANWKLIQYVRGSNDGMYIFPIGTHIQPLQKLVIEARSSTDLLNNYHVAMNIDKFVKTRDVKLVLVDDADEEVGWYSHESYAH